MSAPDGPHGFLAGHSPCVKQSRNSGLMGLGAQRHSQSCMMARRPHLMPAVITNAPGKDAYPLVSFTWLIVPAEVRDESKQAAFDQILHWILTSGQKDCAALGYVPLSRRIVEREMAILAVQH